MADPAAVQLHTLAGCTLAIGAYPHFHYDARGGGGIGTLLSARGNRANLHFAASNLCIPPLNWRSTRILGLPLPPGLAITIAAEPLSGELERSNGAIRLDFNARFVLGVGGKRYSAPPLQVACSLTTGAVEGRRHRAVGQPLNADQQAVLVGIAQVPLSGEAWLDRFLGLPDEALAVLRCQLQW